MVASFIFEVESSTTTGRNNKLLIPFCVFSLAFLALPTCISIDDNTITSTHHIMDSQTLTSPGEVFRLGFFSPGNSTNRYVGIWYTKVSEHSVVWVANRDNPLKDSSGVLKISNDGNLIISDGLGKVYWTTNVSNIPVNDSTAELSDSGNLLLHQVSYESNILWESFQDPSDTFLPTMKIGMDRRSGKKIMIKSAKSESDPSTGNFTLEFEVTFPPQLVTWNGTQRHRRSGPWNSKIFIGTGDMYSVYLDGFHTVVQNEALYIAYKFYNQSSFRRYVLDHSGNLVTQRWDGAGHGWYQIFSTKGDECDVYSKCGAFGSCNILDSPICSCLRGFRPKYTDEWNRGNWSAGCVRKTELQCERNKNTTNQVADRKKDGFFKLKEMKVPDFAHWKAPTNVNECREECLRNCSCLAFAYDGGVGWMIWGQTLLDIRKFTKGNMVDLYIRLADSELDKKKNTKVIIIITVLIGAVIVSICAYLCGRWIAKQRGNQKKEMKISAFDMDNNASDEYLDHNILGDNPELKVFKFETIAVATDHFGGANKLGEGGFGPVYKGLLLNGQEIAVKRLSKGSGQGLEEFKNEVVVILKLQHRNLVRLLGCCIEGDEKMLIYEYMPNKSLDAFLFDPTKRALLDWDTRFQIIEGISRGILYLHRDSRLRVIHRDLKASNILLDGDLNPKISDFGMARIFGGNELQAKTRRVVGTYGYMSPEYAMEGRFSEKSDVFSFGVLLLEIVSGARNSIFYHEDLLSLLGYAWQLWNENKLQSLIDPTLLCKPYIEEEVLGCIHVGLLCVQEFAEDRPTMSTILSMLTSEMTMLPTPRKPAFTEKRNCFESSPSQKIHKVFSTNTVTITKMEGR